MQADPDDKSFETLRFSEYEQLPAAVLVLADFKQASDMRPLEDRRPRLIKAEYFDEQLRNHKLSVQVTLPEHGELVLRFRQLADFDTAALAQQLQTDKSLDASQLEGALACIREDARMTALESVWRGLRMLVDRVPDNVIVNFINCSEEDLIMDFEDSVEISRAGLWQVTHEYNHYGIRPYAGVVLDMSLGPRRDIAGALGDVARRSNLAIFANAAFTEPPKDNHALAPWQPKPDAHLVARCSPGASLQVDRSGSFPARDVPVGAAFIAGTLFARSLGHYRCGAHLTVPELALPGLSLNERLDPAAAAARAARGHLVLEHNGAGVRVAHARSCYLAEGDSGAQADLPIWLLLSRLQQQVRNMQWRKWLVCDPEPSVVVSRINQGLVTRLTQLDWISAQVADPRRVQDGRQQLLRLTLSVTITPTAGEPLRFEEPIFFAREGRS